MFKVRWFTAIEWSWKYADVIAESEADVKAAVDNVCKPEFRNRPYVDEKEDSFTIEGVKDISVPYVFNINETGCFW